MFVFVLKNSGTCNYSYSGVRVKKEHHKSVVGSGGVW